jgi:hypothetical protein
MLMPNPKGTAIFVEKEGKIKSRVKEWKGVLFLSLAVPPWNSSISS